MVSATNRDLEREVRQGRFRKDLFYRLRVAVIEIPPLRERHEDIQSLAEHFLEHFTRRYKKIIRFSPTALQAFYNCQWPGNIREMENLIQSLVITNRSGTIDASELPINMMGYLDANGPDPPENPVPDHGTIEDVLGLSDIVAELDSGTRSLKSIMGEVERNIIRYCLSRCDTHATLAKRLKVDRSTIFRKLSAASKEA